MSHLSYPKKFLLLGSVLTAVTLGFMCSLYLKLNENIQFTAQELQGLTALKEYQILYDDLQAYRQLTHRILKADKETDQYETAGEKLEARFVELDQKENGQGSAFGMNYKWKVLFQKWGALDRNSITTQLFEQQTSLIHALRELMEGVTDRSNLTLEPSFGLYYLIDICFGKLPNLMEHGNQIGLMSHQAQAALSEQDRQALWYQRALLNEGHAGLQKSMEKTIQEIPWLREKYAALPYQYQQALQALSNQIEAVLKPEDLQNTKLPSFSEPANVLGQMNTQLFNVAAAALEIGLQNRLNALHQQVWTNLGFSMFGLLITLYLYAGMYGSIVGNIRGILRGVQRLAQGDLTTQITVDCRDEWSEVIAGLNQMSHSLRTLVYKSLENSRQLLQKSEDLHATSSDVMQNSMILSESAFSMSSAVEEMTVGIGQIANHAKEAQLVASQSGELSEKGGNVILNAANEMAKIAESVKISSEAIKQLGEESQNISTIVNVIKEIADQTNLLALNAAIEAARAGEQGRGFAVVADEVRGLAGRTSKSTQEITAMINNIQSGAQRAVSTMEFGVSQVDNGVALAKQASESIANIRASEARVVQVVNSISEALKEQSLASSEIARNVDRISNMSKENKTSVTLIEQSINVFKNMAIFLEKEIDQFKVEEKK